jgi:hypothetical protein
VRRCWYNRKIGTVRLHDLSGFRWFPAGRGRYGRPSQRWFLHAYMLCTKMLMAQSGIRACTDRRRIASGSA